VLLKKMNNCNQINSFCVAGINYRKSDITVRGKFSLSSDQCGELLSEANKKELSVFVISTCNRTEVYGLCNNPQELAEMLCLHSHGRMKDFADHGYTRQGADAAEHLFRVAAGLDSQIVGDHEILSQLKMATRFSKERECLNSFLERIVSFAFQSSKRIKTETELSSGTVSVSYAAIEIIKEQIADLAGKKVLLVGTGKFGSNIAGNISNYLPEAELHVSNRTDSKASVLADKFNAKFNSYDSLPEACNEADIILVSTSSEQYTILPSYFIESKARLILDLSVPQNVHPNVQQVEGVSLMNVDEISVILDKTIDRRKAEIPKAMDIIHEVLAEMKDWNLMQRNSALLKHVKVQLSELSRSIYSDKCCNERIQKTVSTLAVQLKKNDNKGCQFIHAINAYLHLN
jgi:glutamyl-tRNA reductase